MSAVGSTYGNFSSHKTSVLILLLTLILRECTCLGDADWSPLSLN